MGDWQRWYPRHQSESRQCGGGRTTASSSILHAHRALASADDQHAIQWANSYPSSASAGRKPLPPVAEAVRASVESELQEIVALERQLERETGNTSPKSKPNGVPGIATNVHSNANGGALDGLKQKLATLQA